MFATCSGFALAGWLLCLKEKTRTVKTFLKVNVELEVRWYGLESQIVHSLVTIQLSSSHLCWASDIIFFSYKKGRHFGWHLPHRVRISWEVGESMWYSIRLMVDSQYNSSSQESILVNLHPRPHILNVQKNFKYFKSIQKNKINWLDERIDHQFPHIN